MCFAFTKDIWCLYFIHAVFQMHTYMDLRLCVIVILEQFGKTEKKGTTTKFNWFESVWGDWILVIGFNHIDRCNENIWHFRGFCQLLVRIWDAFSWIYMTTQFLSIVIFYFLIHFAFDMEIPSMVNSAHKPHESFFWKDLFFNSYFSTDSLANFGIVEVDVIFFLFVAELLSRSELVLS